LETRTGSKIAAQAQLVVMKPQLATRLRADDGDFMALLEEAFASSNSVMLQSRSRAGLPSTAQAIIK